MMYVACTILNQLFYLASRYEIRYAEEKSSLIDSWYSNKAIENTDLAEGTLDPVDGGNSVSVHPKPELFMSDKVYYIAMKAYDERNAQSPLSNIAQFEKFIKPGQVTDLQFISQSPSNLTLNFTAPGEDGVFGKGKIMLTGE